MRVAEIRLPKKHITISILIIITILIIIMVIHQL